MEQDLNRRLFLKNTLLAATGLWVGLKLPGTGSGDAKAQLVIPTASPEVANAWINIGLDGKVNFHLERVEMGQGVVTALTTIVAEELNMPPEMVQFYLPYEGPMTGGSSSIRESWDELKRAAAAVREVLVKAAAQKWSVNDSDVQLKDGKLTNQRSGAVLDIGAVVDAASRLRLPSNPTVKDPSTYRFVGKPQARLDNMVKVTGTAQFGIDVKLPGMVYATVKHCPWFDTTIRSFDASEIIGKPGIIKVFKISGAVVVVADSTWRAFQAIKKVKVTWGTSQPQGLMQDDLRRDVLEALKEDGHVVAAHGLMSTFDASTKSLDVTYEAPYVPHVTMEPQNCTVWVETNRVQVWAPTQMPDSARETAADVAGVSSDQVSLYNPYLGGGFGRRLNQDYVEEAVAIGKEMMGTPVKMTWTREEDFQHDFYRPASANRMQGALATDDHSILHWSHKAASPSVTAAMLPSVVKGTVPAWLPQMALGRLGSRLIEKGVVVDPVAVEGAKRIPYRTTNFRMEHVLVARGLPTGAWRSVGNSVNGFVAEGFMDELAHLAGVDPYEYRVRNLENSGSTRNLGVLKLVAEKAGWGKPKPEGVFQGIAQHPSFGSYVATVVEVKKEASRLKILRVIYAVDCGRIVNPDIVTAQIEGGCIFALTAALKQEIHVKNGAVVESNFHDSDLIRMHEAPPVEVYFVNSSSSPGGVGEVGVPPLAPALGNAIFAATGKRYRKMPMSLEFT